jgi:Domain of unknown function (DUF4450)
VANKPKNVPRLRPTRYSAEGGAIVGRNGKRFYNRPLYSANTAAFVLAGDLPLARFASGCSVHGTFFCGVERRGRTIWLQDMDNVTTRFRGNHVRWIVRDRRLPGREFVLDVATLGDEVGFAAGIEVSGARGGDRLVWVYGGAASWPGPQVNLNWQMDPHSKPESCRRPFDPAYCEGNTLRVGAKGFSIAPAASPAIPTFGRSDGWAAPRIGRVSALGSLDQGRSAGPVLTGRVELKAHPRSAWHFHRDEGGPAEAPRERLEAGLARSAALASRLTVETPDARFDAFAAFLPSALDGAWYPPLFRHGAMLWNVPFPGWRTVCGGTALGWHDRVRTEGSYYIGHQERGNRNRSAASDPATRLTSPARNSRFFGRGRIVQDQGIYNMQSQFFDQLMHAWRWTGDSKLEAELRPALELHLEWLRECFDPDGDGLYESVINCWPTDSVWYSGGGATEETSYAYRGHLTARELALRSGDLAAARRHEMVLERISRAFRKGLWVTRAGHAGLYREQGGGRRLHTDAWLYSIFLPIDAGLVTGPEASASLHYTEWALQNDRMPGGGRQVWTSNFTPGIWSVRERWPGDNYHLALAYFKAGQAAHGWDIFRGTFTDTAFNRLVPGDFGASQGGTDFGDCAHMAARTLVEGLFGFEPDVPAGVIRIAPQFPAAWNRANLRTPDVALAYRRRGRTVTLAVETARRARLVVDIPVAAADVRRVFVDGRPAGWGAIPGAGAPVVRVEVPGAQSAEIRVETGAAVKRLAEISLEAVGGSDANLGVRGARIVSFEDPQGAVEGARLVNGRIRGMFRREPGFVLVEAVVVQGILPHRMAFKMRLREGGAAVSNALLTPPARAFWELVGIESALNADIRTIFKQRYLSPRPKTISARIGVDGYSPWTFVYWNAGPPEIGLEKVPGLLREGRLQTPQGVPFLWSPLESARGGRNVAFVSRWDNWPSRVSVRVGRTGQVAWFLVGGSTTVMQGRIANAVLLLHYADGVVERLELVPPINYWNLCPIRVHTGLEGQENRDYYTAATDAFCIPSPPQTVELGENCRVMLLSHRMRPGVVLERVSLEALSQEVVVGLLGVTLMRGRKRGERA